MDKMDKDIDYKVLIENSAKSKNLCLRDKNLGDNDILLLAQALRNSQINYLDLSYNQIKCKGLKYLAQVLESTSITQLNLNNNMISDRGIKYLSEVLKNTAIKKLKLFQNRIHFDGALHLSSVLSESQVETLYLDIYHAKGTRKCITHYFSNGIANVEIKLESNYIGVKGAKYLNDTFIEKGIRTVHLYSKILTADNAQNLSQAFKHMEIGKLEIPKKLFTHHDSTNYLIKIFRKSRINFLSLYKMELGFYIESPIRFLKKIKVFHLDLRYNFVKDYGMRSLARIIKNSDIMYLDLSNNCINSKAVKFLSEILRDSKLLAINLNHNKVDDEGVKHLANGLSHSQITRISLRGNEIQLEGYKNLFRDVENTNLSRISLHQNNITNVGTDFNPERVPRNTIPVATKVRNAFKELVSFDETSKEFEFTVPQCNVDPPIDVDEYAFLVGTIIKEPKLKVHMYDSKYKSHQCNNFTFGKIDKFVDQISDRFNMFINDSNKLGDLVNAFANHNFVSLVKKFEEMNLIDNVQNLLLHRILYYVDENEEILHPYIYKLLQKYDLPLFNERVEPNKKEKIISYFTIHQEFDGACELVSALQSNDLP